MLLDLNMIEILCVPGLCECNGTEEQTESQLAVSAKGATVLYYTILYYTILYYTILYYTILYYPIL